MVLLYQCGFLDLEFWILLNKDSRYFKMSYGKYWKCMDFWIQKLEFWILLGIRIILSEL